MNSAKCTEVTFMYFNKKAMRPRKSDKDVFLAEKLKNANFNTGFYQIPDIGDVEIEKPHGLVLWSRRHKCDDKKNYGLIFYEYDCKFDGKDGIYNTLKYGDDDKIEKLIKELKEFSFVVCPDYSVYGNFPNYKQIDAMSRSREVGCILSSYGIKVVVNFRATYEWSYELALTGICLNGIVSIGTLGCLKDNESRTLLMDSVKELVKYLKPRIIIVYGQAKDDIFKVAKDNGTEIWQFDSEISKSFGGHHYGDEI